MMDGKMFKVFLVLFGMLFFAACGGGGGGSKPLSGPTTTTISGAITFPASADRVGVARRALTTTVDASITVEVYTLDGVLVPSASVHPSYDDATRIYSYSIPNLAPNTDYVIKVKRGSEILKKLIPKAGAAAGSLAGQTIDAASTATIIIASQKLSTNTVSVTLGDVPPVGTTVSSLSAALDASVKPAMLEQTIRAAVGGGSAGITSTTADFANVFNLVVTSLVENKDPVAVFAGHDTLTTGVPIFTISGNTVTAPATDPATWQVPTTDQISGISSGAAQGYTPPTESAATYDHLAAQYLAAQDIANASLNYEKALSIDPNDKEANFGGAITSGLMLMQDPDVNAIAAKWGAVLTPVSQIVQGASPITVPFKNMTSLPVTSSVAIKSAKSSTLGAPQTTNTAKQVLAAFKLLQGKLPQQKAGFVPVAKRFAKVATTPPTVSEMQSVIDNVIIPRINTLLARLAKVEGSGYSFTVTAAMQGNPLYGTPVVLSDGEFYTLDAVLNIFEALFRVSTAYHFDLPSGYTYDTISQDPLAMINSPSVFTLKADGSAKMNAALGNARNATAKASSAYNALKNRAAGVGAFDISNWSAADRTNFTDTINKVNVGLAGPTTLNIGNQQVNIDVTKFFTNPPTRNNLPAFGYDVPRDATLSAKYGKPVAAETANQFPIWNGTGYVTQTFYTPLTCSIVPKTDIPDYTINGILIGNTPANNVAGFNGILPVADGKLLSGASNNGWYYSNTTDGSFIYSLSYNYNYTSGISTMSVLKIDPATGVVTKLADVDPGNVSLTGIFYLNGTFYATGMAWDQTTYVMKQGFYRLSSSTAPWTAVEVAGAPLTDTNSWLIAVTSSGSDVYLVKGTVNPLNYYTMSYDFYRVTGLGTGSVSNTFLFSSSNDSFDYIAVRGNYIYTDSGKAGVVKWDMQGNTLASYETNTGYNLFVGNTMYGLTDGKLLKYGNLP